MGCYSGKVIKKQLRLENKIYFNEECDQYVFNKCRNTKPKSLNIRAKQTKRNWQIGFFDADGEVYFDEILIGESACFASIVRNYWWNGKEGEEKKEGYYSLIKSAKKLEIDEKHINDLLDYVEGKYQAGKHWHIHELDRNIELRIYNGLEETIAKRLSEYFDNIWCNEITADLKAVNNITCSCECYLFRNCKGVVPQKLVINATVEKIDFYDTVSEVHIPEIVMEENANFNNIIQNKYGNYKHEKWYSLLPHVKTLIIRNNHKVLCNLADYINGRYKTGNVWKLHQVNKNMKIVIEKPAMAFRAVKEILDYFTDVSVDSQQAKDYVCKYIKKFQEHFSKYDFVTGRVDDFILADDSLELEDQKLNVIRSNRKIYQLTVKQKIVPQQFICFHDTDDPVAIDKIVIEGGGDLRCVLQNAYYNGTDLGFFSLLQTAKELTICSDQDEDNQVLVDLADYIKGKYALNANWKQEDLDKDMRIKIDSGGYSLSLNVARRLRNYFKNVSVDRIYTPLETENIIDQECRDKYIFVASRETNPKKLVINTKQMGSGTLILFHSADNEIHIPEITINEQGSFAAIVRNHWWNNKEGDEKKSGFYSLVQHVETLTVRNNLVALQDFADYVVGKYKIKYSNCKYQQLSNDNWKFQQLSKQIKIMVEGPGDAFLPVSRIQSCFTDVAVDGRSHDEYLAAWEPWNNPDYKAFVNCFKAYGLVVDPPERLVDAAKELVLEDCYNIRGPVDSIGLLTIKQNMGINCIVCFHDTSKPVVANKIVIQDSGDLRCVLQNAYYSNGYTGFFSLLNTAKKLKISNNEQAVEDLADYVDGEYALHPKWGRQVLNKNMYIKIRHNSKAFSLDVALRLRYYFRDVFIDCIYTPLETENIIDQECENKYVFGNCRDANPQRLIINAKLEGNYNLILFNDADDEVCIPEITIDEYGNFDAIVRNYWWNCKSGNEEKGGYYSLVSHVETLTIQNNPKAVWDLDNYVSGNYKMKQYLPDYWRVHKLSKNITIRINGVSGLDKQINRLKDYFDYIVINGRKSLRNNRQQMLTHINVKSSDIRQRQAQNNQKQQNIDNSVASIQDARQRMENARARLGRRRARFQEYLALAE